MKKYLALLVIGLLASGRTVADNIRTSEKLFWSFDENGKEAFIPEACADLVDAQKLLQEGLTLLSQTDGSETGAAYCILASAFLGNSDAQFTAAQLYHHGAFLPQNDIASYKWALLSALSGNKEADMLGAEIQSTLTPEELDIAHKSLDHLVGEMQNRKTKDLASLDEKIAQLRQGLMETEIEIEDLKYFGKTNAEADKDDLEQTYRRDNRSEEGKVHRFIRNTPEQALPHFNFQDVYRGEK